MPCFCLSACCRHRVAFYALGLPCSLPFSLPVVHLGRLSASLLSAIELPVTQLSHFLVTLACVYVAFSISSLALHITKKAPENARVFSMPTMALTLPSPRLSLDPGFNHLLAVLYAASPCTAGYQLSPLIMPPSAARWLHGHGRRNNQVRL